MSKRREFAFHTTKQHTKILHIVYIKSALCNKVLLCKQRDELKLNGKMFAAVRCGAWRCTYLCGLCILSGAAPRPRLRLHVNRVWQAAGCIWVLRWSISHYYGVWLRSAAVRIYLCMKIQFSLYLVSGSLYNILFCWSMLILSILQALRSSGLTSGANLGRSTNRAKCICAAAI